MTKQSFLVDSGGNAPRMKVSQKEGVAKLSPDHPEPELGQLLIMRALGTMDADFYGGILVQLANAGRQGVKVDEGMLNFMLSVIKAVKPRDELDSSC